MARHTGWTTTGWYAPAPVPPELDRYLACSWTAVPTGRHRLVPDGCIDIVWISTGDLWVCGPETTAWQFELPAGSTSVGVRFLPGVGAPLLGVSCSTITERRVRLRDVLGEPVEADLLARIAAMPALGRRRDVIQRFAADLIHARAHAAHAELDLAARVLNALAASPHAGAGELAAALGISVRQLHRRSLRLFGYGTSVLARLLRLQRLLSLASTEATHGRRPTLAVLAARAGYTDQAHLGRDCRTITGLAPNELLRDYFPTFPDMSDPYKTDIALADSA